MSLWMYPSSSLPIHEPYPNRIHTPPHCSQSRPHRAATVPRSHRKSVDRPVDPAWTVGDNRAEPVRVCTAGTGWRPLLHTASTCANKGWPGLTRLLHRTHSTDEDDEVSLPIEQEQSPAWGEIRVGGGDAALGPAP